MRNLGSMTTGLRRTGLDADRDGLLYVPELYNPKTASPLIVMMHGAGGTAQQSIDPWRELADRTGTIILAPESQGETWDLLLDGYGTDVVWMDEALSDVFALYRIDQKHLAIAGFSDGASYAISLGLANGDLFSHIIAFSPGFARLREITGSPSIYISHGTKDRILPIENCSRKLVPQLSEAGLEVAYDEFDGGHTIPTEIGRKSFAWFMGYEAFVETEGAKVRSSESGIEFT